MIGEWIPGRGRIVAVACGSDWTVSEIARHTGLKHRSVRERLERGWTGVRLLHSRTDRQARRDRLALIDGETRYEDDPRCQYVVAAHPDGLEWAQIGELMGCSAQAVRQVTDRALRKLAALDFEDAADVTEWAYPEAAE